MDGGQILLFILVLLAVAATVIMLLTDSGEALKIALLAALWSALTGTFLVGRYRGHLERSRSDLARERDMRRRAELAAQQEPERPESAGEDNHLSEEDMEVLLDIRRSLDEMRGRLEDLTGQLFGYEPAAVRAESWRLRELEDRAAQASPGGAHAIRHPAKTGNVAGAPSVDAVRDSLADHDALSPELARILEDDERRGVDSSRDGRGAGRAAHSEYDARPSFRPAPEDPPGAGGSAGPDAAYSVASAFAGYEAPDLVGDAARGASSYSAAPPVSEAEETKQMTPILDVEEASAGATEGADIGMAEDYPRARPAPSGARPPMSAASGRYAVGESLTGAHSDDYAPGYGYGQHSAPEEDPVARVGGGSHRVESSSPMVDTAARFSPITGEPLGGSHRGEGLGRHRSTPRGNESEYRGGRRRAEEPASPWAGGAGGRPHPQPPRRERIRRDAAPERPVSRRRGTDSSLDGESVDELIARLREEESR